MVFDPALLDRRAARVSAPVPVIVNRTGGTAAARGDALRGEIEAAFADAGLAIDLQLLDGGEVQDAVKAASGQPLMIVGGGDGTLGGAADTLSKAGSTLGILPLGTRNHLALQLGIPPDLPGAARLIAANTTKRIDLARLNGRAFVNNASIGLYPDFVRQRDAMALPKQFAALPATVNTLRQLQDQQLCLHIDGKDQPVTTPMLFVGNNRYSLAAGRLGQRDRLDDGLLSVYAVAPRRLPALISFALRMLVGRGDPTHDFVAITETSGFTVSAEGKEIQVALDGEVDGFALPLCFTLEAKALSVIAPLEELVNVP
jgi:diacylglycerol kinase family enzyme